MSNEGMEAWVAKSLQMIAPVLSLINSIKIQDFAEGGDYDLEEN